MHTHYDGQAMWDPLLGPSCWHGVTTAMFGNCGVGFAPVRPQHRAALMDLMEGIEEIPGVVLTDGLTWEWESFPDFLDALERRPHAIDIAAQIAHLPLRVYVMGDRAIRLEAATADDIAEMRRLTVEALRVGAFGFTTTRTDSHKTPIGEMVPSRYAASEELLGIGSALGDAGTGAFGMNSDFDDEAAELDWLTHSRKETGRPVWFLLTDRYEDPARWRRLLAAVHAARAEGLQLTAQIAGRPIEVCSASAPRSTRSIQAELPPARRPEYRSATPAFARPGAPAQDPRREAFRAGREPTGPVPPTHHDPLGQVFHHGGPAGLRAG